MPRTKHHHVEEMELLRQQKGRYTPKIFGPKFIKCTLADMGLRGEIHLPSFENLAPLKLNNDKVGYVDSNKCSGAIQKSISSLIAEFGRYGGRWFITNSLSVMEWNLTMFSIKFCKVSMLDDVKERQKQPEAYAALEKYVTWPQS